MKIDRERLRQSILLTVEPAGDVGLRPQTIHHQVRLDGFPSLDYNALALELVYLADKQFLVAERSVISAGTMTYRLAPAGREYLEAEQLI